MTITLPAAVTPVSATPSDLPAPVLQPGAVVEARVLQLLADGQAKISIAGMALDVMATADLAVGDVLRLAVSETAQGIRLAVVGQAHPQAPAVASGAAGTALAASQAATPSGPASSTASAASSSAPSSSAPSAPAKAELPAPPAAVAPSALAEAVQSAASRQTSQAPLFSDLEAAVVAGRLPADVQKAGSQVLALRPELTESLDAAALKTAFQRSGLFMESALANDALTSMPGSSTPLPDLKAALIVLRQVLANWNAEIGAPVTAAPAATLVPSAGQGSGTAPAAPQSSASPPAMPLSSAAVSAGSAPAGNAMAAPQAPATPASPASLASAPPLVPAALPELADEIVIPAFLPRSPVPAGGTRSTPSVTALATAATAASAGAAGAKPLPQPFAQALTLLQEMQQELDGLNDGLLPLARNLGRAAVDAQPPGGHFASTSASSHLPPPVRGAAPAAQAIAAPLIQPDMPDDAVAHRLLDDVDGALARHVLLQAASLPDAGAASARTETTGPVWHFEIPFATPQGTAMAQFEIARDGAQDSAAAEAVPVWKARFTVTVEPAGPVHAQIVLAGERTSVRLWAERSATTEQLRVRAADLSTALREAELEPGDIIVGEGRGPQASPSVRRGHFLDRAS